MNKYLCDTCGNKLREDICGWCSGEAYNQIKDKPYKDRYIVYHRENHLTKQLIAAHLRDCLNLHCLTCGKDLKVNKLYCCQSCSSVHTKILTTYRNRSGLCPKKRRLSKYAR